MIVSCLKCSTKYNLKADTIGDDGRRVRCTKCGHIWIQHNTKKSSVSKAESGVKVDISRNLPVVIEYIVPVWFKSLPLVFLTLIVFTLIFFFHEPLSNRSHTLRGLYEKIGVIYTGNIVIDKANILKVGDNQYDITGFLVNKSQEIRRVPSVVVKAIDDRNRRVGYFKIKSSPIEMSSGAEYAFSKHIENLPANTKLLVVEVQDKFDWLRR